MRVFSQINNCQQKQNKKQNKKQKQKTDKTKRGDPLLGLAKSIYYYILTLPKLFFLTTHADEKYLKNLTWELSIILRLNEKIHDKAILKLILKVSE